MNPSLRIYMSKSCFSKLRRTHVFKERKWYSCNVPTAGVLENKIFSNKKTMWSRSNCCICKASSCFCNVFSAARLGTLSRNALLTNHLDKLWTEYQEAEEKDGDYQNLSIRKAQLKPLIQLLTERRNLEKELCDLDDLLQGSDVDKELRRLAEEEKGQLYQKIAELEDQATELLVVPEPFDNRNVVLEVMAGVGGQEAMLFSQDVLDMYAGYADYRNWDFSILDLEQTELGGLRHASACIAGRDVYRRLKYEAGVHRVQRVPKTEKSGRVHTSTVAVAVLPQPTEVDVTIDPKDLKIETKRASGAGGQHVNTTDSAVRITHLPSGLVVECQAGRSQFRNKDQALLRLRAKLYQQKIDKQQAKIYTTRKLQVGTGARSEKIRTYNFLQDRVTDHRVGVSRHNLHEFLAGGQLLDEMIEQLLEEARQEQLNEVLEQSTKQNVQ